MSYFSNVSAFMAIGRRFTLDIKIFGWGGKPQYVLQIDVEGTNRYGVDMDPFVDAFDAAYDDLLLALQNHCVSPVPGKSPTEGWRLWFESTFEMHEYHYVERFVAIAELVAKLSQE